MAIVKPRRDLSRPLERVEFLVPEEQAGLRLDRWLAETAPWRSRTDLQRRIADGRVLVDGLRANKSHRVLEGQRVELRIDSVRDDDVIPDPAADLDILYEDEDLVAIDKAPGRVVHPVGRYVNDTLINSLSRRYAESTAPGERSIEPMIVHRLDRDTSGVLVFAKHGEARVRLGKAFEGREVRKTYLALVDGHPSEDAGTIEAPIGPNEEDPSGLTVRIRADGRASSTGYEVLERMGDFSLVRCHPLTGRQHQIRIHLAHLGHPILCDAHYGAKGAFVAGRLDPDCSDPDHPLLARQALHAESLRLKHPSRGEELLLEAPLAEDLAFLT